jgi:hypothetical protein
LNQRKTYKIKELQLIGGQIVPKYKVYAMSKIPHRISNCFKVKLEIFLSIT